MFSIFDYLRREKKIFFIYICISTFVTSLDVLFLFLLTTVLGVYYLLSAIFSYITCLILSYSLNRKFTFKGSNKNVIIQFSQFAFVALVGLIITLICMYLFTDILGLYYLIGKLVGIGVGFLWNYTINRNFTFI